MLTIELKRGGVWRQLDFEDVNMSLNFSIVNLGNPAKYKTEFSKTVDLPLTKANRIAFGFTERLDSMQTTSLSLARGIPARVFNDGDLIFDGKYAVTKVDVAEEKISGNLYGVVNDWYNKMMELNFSNGFPEVLSDDFVINKQTVYDSWVKNPNNRNSSLILPGQTNYSAHDFIGFAPTINGEVNNFDSKSLVYGTGSNAKIKKFWEGFDASGADPSRPYISDPTSICEGPSERQTMQYRSYNQKPYFYFDKLCQLVKKVANERDDLPTINLDYEWFNNDNPFYKNVVYLLPNLVSDTEDAHTQKYSIDLDVSHVTASLGNTLLNYPNNQAKTYMYEVPFEKAANANDPHNTIHDGKIYGRNSEMNLSIRFHLNNMPFTAQNSWTNWTSIPGWPNANVKLYGSIALRAELRYANGVVVPNSTKTLASWNSDNSTCSVSISATNGNSRIHTYSWTLSGGTYTYTFNDMLALGTEWRLFVGLVFTPKNYSDTLNSGLTRYTLWQQINSYRYAGGNVVNYSNLIFCNATRETTRMTGTSIGGRTPANIFYLESQRSGRHLQIGDIWKSDNENSPFKVFIKYCKMMNLVFDYDQHQNILNILPREKFFLSAIQRDGNVIADWTDRVDWGKDVTFKPIQWEKKYILFNYETVDADRLKDFSDKYGYGYGTKKITTMYDYNSEEEKLFIDNDKINASAEMSEFMYTLRDIWLIATDSNQTPEAKLPNESFIINKKAKDSADTENCFFFRGANGTWDSTVSKTPGGATITNGVWITDDSSEELRQDTFCHQVPWDDTSSHPDTANVIKCSSRPVFTKFNNDACLHFSNPSEDYFNPAVVTRNDNDIYNIRWKNFIEETYNEQNKLMTCKMYLSPTDYQSIKNGKFVRIDNVIYLVNTIKDYNPAKYGLTQVELLQVSDLSAYIGRIYEEPVRHSLNPNNNEPQPEPVPSLDVPFYFQNDTDSNQNIILKHTYGRNPEISVSLDNETWNSITVTSGDVPLATLTPRQKLYVKASISGNYWEWSYYHDYSYARFSGYTKIGGNVMSLYYGASFDGTETDFYQHSFTPGTTSDSYHTNVIPLLNEATNVEMLNLPATLIPRNGYASLFSGSSIERGPNFGEVTTVNYQGSVSRMFEHCTRLNYINWPGSAVIDSGNGYQWVNDVAQTGIFQILNTSQLSWSRGVSGIPEGWMILAGD